MLVKDHDDVVGDLGLGFMVRVYGQGYGQGWGIATYLRFARPLFKPQFALIVDPRPLVVRSFHGLGSVVGQ